MIKKIFLKHIFLCLLYLLINTIDIFPQQQTLIIYNYNSQQYGMTYDGNYTFNPQVLGLEIGYNLLNNDFNRGYLEFDISAIPSNATINSAFIHLMCVSPLGNNTNTGGTILLRKLLYRSITLTSSDDWNLLIGTTTLASTYIDWGESVNIGGQALLDEINYLRYGGFLFLGIKNSSESSNGLGFSVFNSDLYLSVTYTVPNLPPSIPNGLLSSNITTNSFTLLWNASTDPDGDPITYQVYKNGVAYGSPTSNTYLSITGLTACTTYSMTVKAKDNNGNESPASSVKAVTTAGCCETNRTLVSTTHDVSSGVHNFLASNSITASNKISGTADVHIGAYGNVRLITGFKANTGTKLNVDLIGCTALKSTRKSPEEPGDNMGDELSGGIYFYPNPSDGLIKVNFAGIEGNKLIYIYNLAGSLVFQNQDSGYETDINLQDHPKGIYIIKVIHENGIYQNKLIIE